MRATRRLPCIAVPFAVCTRAGCATRTSAGSTSSISSTCSAPSIVATSARASSDRRGYGATTQTTAVWPRKSRGRASPHGSGPENGFARPYGSPTWLQKADILRYELLWQFGGVYVDADSLALRPLDPLLANVEMFAGYERGTSGLVANGVIGCTPRHPDMDRMIRDLSIEGSDAWETVGPLYFTRMIDSYQMQLTIYPACYFYPIHHTERIRLYWGVSPSDARLRGSFLVQYWGTTTNFYEPWLRRIARRLRYAIDRRPGR